MSEVGITQETNSDEYAETRTERIVGLVADFWKRNTITTIAGSSLAGSFIGSPPQNPTEVAGRLAVVAGILAGTHIMDRKEGKWEKQREERIARRNNTR